MRLGEWNVIQSCALEKGQPTSAALLLIMLRVSWLQSLTGDRPLIGSFWCQCYCNSWQSCQSLDIQCLAILQIVVSSLSYQAIRERPFLLFILHWLYPKYYQTATAGLPFIFFAVTAFVVIFSNRELTVKTKN